MERSPGGVLGGRLLREGDARIVASTEERDDWRATLALDASSVPESDRIAVAAHYRAMAAAAHAAVPSFARVSLQLAALGAPADLVAGVHVAALEAIDHAKACFGLASAFSGFPEGPGALPVEALRVRALQLEEL